MEQHVTTCASAFCALVLSYAVLCESLCRVFGASIRFVTSVLRTALRAAVQSAPALQTLKGFPGIGNGGNVGNVGNGGNAQVRCHETCEAWLCPSQH